MFLILKQHLTHRNDVRLGDNHSIDALGDNVPSNLVRDNLSANIYHLNVGHIVLFFVFSKRNIL